MYRSKRNQLRQNKKSSKNDLMRAAEIAAMQENVPFKEFITWTFEKLAQKFKEERMNKRIVIENEIRNLGLRFPNGNVKHHYQYNFILPTDMIQVIGMEGVEELGLDFKPLEGNNFVIVGIPTQVGDFKLKLRYKTLEGEPESEIEIPIAFNADPRDLWKPIPVPANIEFPKEDEATDYVLVEEFEGNPQKDIVAASKRGRSHAQNGKPRDDDFKISFNKESGWYILAVADGAGSAKYSREGSRIACKTIEEYCKVKLEEEGKKFEELIKQYESEKSQENLKPVVEMIHGILFKGATEAHKAIVQRVEECSQSSATLRDFATTLLVAICRKFDFGWFIASFGVGDGAIGLYIKDKHEIKLLNEPDGGEYAGQTRFLTMESIFKDKPRIKMTIVPDFKALILMTDGISDPMFETDSNLANVNKWDAFWDELTDKVDLSDDNAESKYQLLEWLDFWSPGNHDDRTIAILY